MLVMEHIRITAHGMSRLAARSRGVPRLRRAGLMAALALTGLAGASVHAAETTADAMALARANVCLGCHQVDTRRVGPPFRAIGERFAGKGDDAANAAYLASAIQKGSRGNWGALTMPAQPQVSDAEARQLADWILSLGKTTP